MNSQHTHIFFVGIGGIGMSALARYFKKLGKNVAGYDRAASVLTKKLEEEGIELFYSDNINTLSKGFLDAENCKVVYTPAISKNNSLLNYFVDNNFELVKRAKVLGEISSQYKTIAVAGTHGKTTISILIAHLLRNSGFKVNALLGGISLDFQSNMLWDENAEVLVTEADEYDQSFLQLNPDIAVITSVDADHLDVYGEAGVVLESFQTFSRKISDSGTLISKAPLMSNFPLERTKKVSYSFGEKTNYSAMNVHVSNGKYIFDLITPDSNIEEWECGLPGRHNVENAIAALAVCIEMKADIGKLKDALSNFKGVNRRFDVHYHRGNKVYIDDYAHHPTEIKVLIKSLRDLYPQLKITGVFQPHLYSRTRDFAEDFAESLSQLDELILLDIYPAREEPIEGINSEWLLEKISVDKKEQCQLSELPDILKNKELEVLLTIGAGDIDKMVEPIKQMLNSRS